MCRPHGALGGRVDVRGSGARSRAPAKSPIAGSYPRSYTWLPSDSRRCSRAPNARIGAECDTPWLGVTSGVPLPVEPGRDVVINARRLDCGVMGRTTRRSRVSPLVVDPVVTRGSDIMSVLPSLIGNSDRLCLRRERHWLGCRPRSALGATYTTPPAGPGISETPTRSPLPVAAPTAASLRHRSLPTRQPRSHCQRRRRQSTSPGGGSASTPRFAPGEAVDGAWWALLRQCQ